MNKHTQPDLSTTRTESSGHYHCSIYMIDPVGKRQWTGPYANVDELVQMTGKPYAEWLKQNPKRVVRQRAAMQPKTPKVNLFELLQA